jgi:hypothetical protein
VNRMGASNLVPKIQGAPSWFRGSSGKPAPPTCAGLSRMGQGTCFSHFPRTPAGATRAPTPRPQPNPPNFAARRVPSGPRPTSLGLSCGGGGGAAAGPLSPTLSPGEAAAHNCE